MNRGLLVFVALLLLPFCRDAVPGCGCPPPPLDDAFLEQQKKIVLDTTKTPTERARAILDFSTRDTPREQTAADAAEFLDRVTSDPAMPLAVRFAADLYRVNLRRTGTFYSWSDGRPPTAEETARILAFIRGAVASDDEAAHSVLYAAAERRWFTPVDTLRALKHKSVVVRQAGMRGSAIEGQNPFAAAGNELLIYHPPDRVPGKTVPTDVHGDRLPRGAVARLGSFRTALNMWGHVFAFSPNGSRIASAATSDYAPDGVRLWDRNSGEQLLQLLGAYSVQKLQFSPDGRLLAGLFNYGSRLFLVDTLTGKEVFCTSLPSGSGIAFIDHGRILAADARDGEWSETHSIQRWATAAGTQLEPVRLTHHPHAWVVSADGKTLFSLGWKRDGKNYQGAWHFITSDAGTGRELGSVELEGLKYVDNNYSRAVLSPDARWLATAYKPETADARENPVVQVWDAATGKKRTAFPAPRGSDGISFSRDGRLLLVLGGPNYSATGIYGARDLALYRVPEGNKVTEITGRGLTAADVSDDGKMLVTDIPGVGMEVWDVATRRKLLAPAERGAHVYDLRLGPGSATIETIGDDRKRTWDVASAKLLEDVKRGSEPFTRPKSAGEALASGNPYYAFRVLPPWEPEPARDRKWETVSSAYGCADFHSGGILLVTGHRDARVSLWDRRCGIELVRLTGHGAQVSCVLFSPDSRRLFSGSEDGTVLVWTLEPRDWAGDRLRQEPSQAHLEALWAELGSDDTLDAFSAMCALQLIGNPSVSVLRRHLLEILHEDNQLRTAIADLDQENWELRCAASDLLARLGPLAEPALRKLLELSSSADGRFLAELHTAQLPRPRPYPSGVHLQRIRAILALERMGTKEALDVLRELAEKAPLAFETRYARAVAERAMK